MNLERAAMMGKLAEARQKRQRLELKVEGNSRLICQGLNILLTPAADLEIPLLDEQWDELKSAWADLQVTNSEISRLERALN